MKKYLLFLSFIVPAFVFSQNDSASLYHLLQIGNEWIYKSSASFFSRKIVGDTLLSGIPYVIIKENDAKTKQILYVYERYDTLSGAFYSLRSSTEDMLDSVSVTAPNKLFNSNLMRFVSAVPETILGTPTVSRTIQMNLVGLTREWKFSYGIGLTKDLGVDHVWGTGGALILAYAKINGKEFGIDPQKQQRDSLLQFYPIHSGDTWVYKIDTTHLYVIETIQKDTVMSNGKKYFLRVKERKNLALGELLSLGLFYERIDTNTLQIFNFFTNDEMQRDSLLSRKGDTTSFRAIYADNGMSTIFGSNRAFRTLKFPMPPFETIVQYSHGIGVTQRTENAYYDEYPYSLYKSITYNIVYAKINGIEHGSNPLSVDDEQNALPSTFSLSQNYPNPFNPATVIKYQIPATNLVTVKVYDILGREVATLVNDIQESGYYSVSFNASALSSGLYIYQLRSKDFIQTKKMMFLK